MKRATEAAPRSVEVLTATATLQENAGQVDAAVHFFESAVALRPDCDVLYAGYLALMRRRNREPRARQRFGPPGGPAQAARAARAQGPWLSIQTWAAGSNPADQVPDWASVLEPTTLEKAVEARLDAMLRGVAGDLGGDDPAPRWDPWLAPSP